MFGPLNFLDDLFGSAGDVLGWTWEKVIAGIFIWVAKGQLLLMEWVLGQLDASTTPRLTDDWFANGLVRQVALMGVGVTTIMMLISAVQMGWAGRPELFGDAIRNGAKAILGSAMAVFLLDAGVQMGDGLSDSIWAAGRGDVLSMMDGSASAMTVGAEVVGLTFLGPFLVLIGLIGFLMITTILFFRSVMIYLVAAFAPIPLALSAGTTFRGATRRVVSLSISLVLAKPAIVLTLVVGAKLTANAGTDAGVSEGIGALVSGFLVFLVAAFAPMLIFKLLPMVGDASITSGVLSGMGRSGMTAAQAGLLGASAGSSLSTSAATRSVAGGSSSGSAGSSPLVVLPVGGTYGSTPGGGAGLAGASGLGGGSTSTSSSAPGLASGLSAANQGPIDSGGASHGDTGDESGRER